MIEPKFGVNYRKEIANNILENIKAFDFIEINTERFFVKENDIALNQILSNVPTILHGLSLSLGDTNDIDSGYFSKINKALDISNCLWFSEHIAATKVNGIETRSLMPVCFNDKTAINISNKINRIIASTRKPFIIENITYYFIMPGSTHSEIDFINSILDQTEAGILLDLNNLYCNSLNHGYDPIEFISKLPKERIVELHLAGGVKINDLYVDTHSTRISDEVFNLFEYCCKYIPFKGVVLERDIGPQCFNDILEDMTIMRNILEKSR